MFDNDKASLLGPRDLRARLLYMCLYMCRPSRPTSSWWDPDRFAQVGAGAEISIWPAASSGRV